MNPLMSRRTFTKTGMAAALGMTALQTTRVLGANDRVSPGRDRHRAIAAAR